MTNTEHLLFDSNAMMSLSTKWKQKFKSICSTNVFFSFDISIEISNIEKLFPLTIHFQNRSLELITKCLCLYLMYLNSCFFFLQQKVHCFYQTRAFLKSKNNRQRNIFKYDKMDEEIYLICLVAIFFFFFWFTEIINLLINVFNKNPWFQCKFIRMFGILQDMPHPFDHCI